MKKIKFPLVKAMFRQFFEGKRYWVYGTILALCAGLSFIPHPWAMTASVSLCGSVFIILPMELYLTLKEKESQCFRNLADPNHPTTCIRFKDPLCPRLSLKEMQKIAAPFNRKIIQDKNVAPDMVFISSAPADEFTIRA